MFDVGSAILLAYVLLTAIASLVASALKTTPGLRTIVA